MLIGGGPVNANVIGQNVRKQADNCNHAVIEHNH
jgi:hypothetical protein